MRVRVLTFLNEDIVQQSSAPRCVSSAALWRLLGAGVLSVSFLLLVVRHLFLVAWHLLLLVRHLLLLAVLFVFCSISLCKTNNERFRCLSTGRRFDRSDRSAQLVTLASAKLLLRSHVKATAWIGAARLGGRGGVSHPNNMIVIYTYNHNVYMYICNIIYVYVYKVTWFRTCKAKSTSDRS